MRGNLVKKGIISVFLVVFIIYFIPGVIAPCPVIVAPPQKFIDLDDNNRALIVFNEKENKEITVIEPTFHGNAQDFGMIIPFPDRPELSEADENLFNELEDLTNPIIAGELGITSTGSSFKDVEIIEVKDVGDFTATVLTAENTLGLIKWLNDNNYAFRTGDIENLEYYVDEGGYFFVVLKVNVEKAKVDENGNINGRLSPIEFSYNSDKPMLRIRVMRSDMEGMGVTLYTLSDSPYYVPGTKILFSRKLTEFDFDVAPTLKKYAVSGDWLLRSDIRFDPPNIEKDSFLKKGNNNLIIESPDKFKIVDPHLLTKERGILIANGPILYLEEEEIGDYFDYLKREKYGLMVFLNGLLFGIIIVLIVLFIRGKDRYK
ncbi:MAG: DUF2330 domain-containing protein [Nanoarchaeota archaeon]|nr:DUF2330 domain-containing protein [Nanoarchaeota archaeon]